MREPYVEYVTANLAPDTLLVACGLPASYKTETTEVAAERLGFTMLRSDLIRLEVLAGEDIFDEKVASSMEKRTAVYDEMFRRADEVAAEKGRGVVLDATFVTQELRRRAAEIAARHGKTLVIQQTVCPREVSIRRILRRTKERYESNALTERAYENNVRRFEPVDLADLEGRHPGLAIVHLLVDTTSDEPEDWRVIARTDA